MEKKIPLYTNYPFSLSTLDEALFATAEPYGFCAAPLIHHTVFHSRLLDEEAIVTYWKAQRWGHLGIVTKAAHGDYRNHPLPYYIACLDTVIMLNANGNGCRITSEALAKTVIALQTDNQTLDLVKIIPDEASLLTSGAVFPGKHLRVLESMICPVGIYDYDMLMAATTDNIPLPMKQALIDAFLNYYRLNERYESLTTYITLDAVKDWLKNGREYVVGNKYLNTFSLEARKTAVSRLAQLNHVKIIKDQQVQLPKAYSMEAFDLSLHSHLIFTQPDIPVYELYSELPYSRIQGLEEFANTLFTYIALSYNTHSDAERQALLT